MGKCYTLSFDSTLYYGGANNNKRTYYVDWTFLPENTRFKVTFSYMSVAGGVDGLQYVCSVLANLGTTSNFYANSIGNVPTQYLGSLKCATQTTSASNGYFYADQTSNVPVWIEQRPTQNVLEIQIHQGLNGVNFASPVPPNYVLTLCFHAENGD